MLAAKPINVLMSVDDVSSTDDTTMTKSSLVDIVHELVYDGTLEWLSDDDVEMMVDFYIIHTFFDIDDIYEIMIEKVLKKYSDDQTVKFINELQDIHIVLM